MVSANMEIVRGGTLVHFMPSGHYMTFKLSDLAVPLTLDEQFQTSLLIR